MLKRVYKTYVETTLYFNVTYRDINTLIQRYNHVGLLAGRCYLFNFSLTQLVIIVT